MSRQHLGRRPPVLVEGQRKSYTSAPAEIAPNVRCGAGPGLYEDSWGEKVLIRRCEHAGCAKTNGRRSNKRRARRDVHTGPSLTAPMRPCVNPGSPICIQSPDDVPGRGHTYPGRDCENSTHQHPRLSETIMYAARPGLDQTTSLRDPTVCDSSRLRARWIRWPA